jgi:uncharacterized protein
MSYWDTSCLIKLYVPEADSAECRAHVVGGATLATSEIARLEMYAALQRKEARNDLHPGGARRALAAYDADVAAGFVSVIAMDPAIVEKFEVIIDRCHHQSPPVLLRTLDAIHLASASVAAESEVVATDKRLREAALSLGFSVYPFP